ncbi:MAG: hypothetical protein ABI443_03295 [Chthoniobacterales bacterium]
MLSTILCVTDSLKTVEEMTARLSGENIGDILVLLHHREEDVHIPEIAGLTQLNTPSYGAMTTKGVIAGASVAGLTTAAGLFVPLVGVIVFAALPFTAFAGAAIGAIAGAFLGISDHNTENRIATAFGISKEQLATYQKKLSNGAYVVAVHAEGQTKIDWATNVFQDAGAEDIMVLV